MKLLDQRQSAPNHGNGPRAGRMLRQKSIASPVRQGSSCLDVCPAIRPRHPLKVHNTWGHPGSQHDLHHSHPSCMKYSFRMSHLCREDKAITTYHLLLHHIQATTTQHEGRKFSIRKSHQTNTRAGYIKQAPALHRMKAKR